jgi:hypothetical protein
LVGIHIDRGDSKASVLSMAKAWARRCKPAYPEADAERTVNNLYAKAEAKGEYQPVAERNGHVDGDHSLIRIPDLPADSIPLSDEDDGPTVPVLGDDAFYGVLGEYVRLIEPHTEADPAAILVAGLVAFGNACGNGPNYVVEADRHHTNLFAVCVGESGHGRKGVSLGRALALFPEEFVKNNISQGLSSGEGLIFAVRDQTTKFNAKDEVLEIIDPGVSDKRLLVTETEYAQTLKVLKREGNTLSPILRVAFDGGVLRAMTKNQTKATDPHISIVAHVTRQELKKCLGESEYFNGFANRFLWAITRRTKLISENGDTVDISPFQQRVANALSQAQAVTTMKRSEEARTLWRDLYVKLNEDRSGMFGACTSRAAPITLRLSMIYALADGVDVIEVKHLQAAHAVWRYCEASARLIFGEEQADALTAEVHRLICARPGLTKTGLLNAFNRNVPAKDIAGALVTLYGRGRIICALDKSGPGRPSERWYPAGQQVPPPSQPDPPLRMNELTNKVLANGQAGAEAGDSSLIRLFVDQPAPAQADGQAGESSLVRLFVDHAGPGQVNGQTQANGQAGADGQTKTDAQTQAAGQAKTAGQAGPGAAEALARPASKELPTLLSNHAEAQHHAEGHAEADAQAQAEADDDPEFLAILKRIEARPKAKLPLGTALLTPWGVPAKLTDVYEGFATSPVEIVNGVIVTPLAMLYCLVMDSQAKDQCPALAGRGIDLGNGKTVLDLPIAEVEAWSKA